MRVMAADHTAFVQAVGTAARELFRDSPDIALDGVRIARTRNTNGPGHEYWLGLNFLTGDPKALEDPATGRYDYARKKSLMYKIWDDDTIKAAARPFVDAGDSIVPYIDLDCKESDHVSGICEFPPVKPYTCDFRPASELNEGGLLKQCTEKYGLPFYLLRGPSIIISPDVITPEIFEAIGRGPKSLVVFGGGAGTDAYMAERLGYQDVTVVDINQGVVDFHNQEFGKKFPRFKAVRANVMDEGVAELLEKPVDVAVLAVNYEVNPFLVRKLQHQLRRNVGAFAVLPNLPNYYTEFGDALVGGRWPFGPDARLQAHFKNLADFWYHYERGLIASNDSGVVDRANRHFANAPQPEILA